MSHIGSNIRKIRGVKNLNQSSFAELFDLKRASVGAYEEGRAEPKIKTIIDIAKYFGISIDDLLTKELSVNDLYKFDIFREDLLKDTKHNLTPSTPSIEVIPIPLINSQKQSDYLANHDNPEFLNTLDTINIPLAKGGNYRAFEILDNSMYSDGNGLQKGDIVISEKPRNFKINKLEEGKIYLFETSDSILIRQLSEKSSKAYELSPLNTSFYREQLDNKEILDVWQLKISISNNISISNQIDNRIKQLEMQLSDLKKKNS